MYVAMYTRLLAFALYVLSARAAPTIERKDTKGSLLLYTYCSSRLFRPRNNHCRTDPGVFAELHRAAQLSSAAYSDCQNQAFDVTITKQLDDHETGTQVFHNRLYLSVSSIITPDFT